MPLGNPRSIVGQAILLDNFLSNLLLMISRYYLLITTAFLTAIISAWVNFDLYLAIALGLLALALLFLASANISSQNYANWNTQGGIKETVIVISLVVFCLLVPQVETNIATFTSPIEDLKHH
ncbi:MAG: hypothetical protein AAFV28_10145 [Cyanobacteria bacterium J06635_13]